MQIWTSLKVHSDIKMVRSSSGYIPKRRGLRIGSWDSLKEPTDNRFSKVNNLSVYGLGETGKQLGLVGEEKKL